MQALWHKPGAAAVAVAVVMLLQLGAVFIFLHATEDGVSLGGTPIGGACLFRQRTGLPCPTCGMTRSVVLSVHGQIPAALRLNPAGPLWVLAVATISAALLWLGWRQRAGGAAQATRHVRILALAQGGLVGLVLAVHWIHAVFVRM